MRFPAAFLWFSIAVASIVGVSGCTPQPKIAPEKLKEIFGEESINPYPEDLTSDFHRVADGWQADGPATDKDLQRLLAKHHKIGMIRLNQASISAAGLASLKGHGVTGVEIQSSGITGAMVKELSRLDGLEVVGLKDPSANDQVVSELIGPRSLKKLIFKDATITSNGIKTVFTNFPQLRYLALHKCPGVNDAAVTNLCKFRKLESLCLGGTSLTELGIAQLIEKLPLTYLKCDREHVGERVIEKLARSKVIQLDLIRNQLSKQSVQALAKLKKLKSLLLLDCGTVADGSKAWLQAVLPGCVVRTSGDREEKPAVGMFDK